jgi:hypothetical protein
LDKNTQILLDKNAQILLDKNAQILLDKNAQILLDKNAQIVTCKRVVLLEPPTNHFVMRRVGQTRTEHARMHHDSQQASHCRGQTVVSQ